MNVLTDSIARALRQGFSWFMFAIAILSFWFGGRLISEVAKTDRILGEMGGIGIAVVCAGIGAIAKPAEDPSEGRVDDAS